MELEEEIEIIPNDFCKDILRVYLKHGYGDEKLYSILFTLPHINENSVLLTIQEFFNKYCKEEKKMTYKYNKDSLKENLSIEEVFELISELGGEPQMITKDTFTAKTICHNLITANASRKLYYYDNTHLFHCYTECGDSSFDIYELIQKIYKNNGIKNFTLGKAIIYVAKFFGYSTETFDFEEDKIEQLEDWKIINAFKRKEEDSSTKRVELKIFDDKILKFLPHPHILPWEMEGISFNVMESKGICYDPLNMGVVIPHYDINNNLIGIRERTLVKENEIFGKYRPALINGVLYNHPLGYNCYNLNNSKDNIKKIKKAIIVEGEKSCLLYSSYFGEENDITVACCGSNITKYQMQLLLNLGIDEVIIAFDKQFQEIGDEEWKKWTAKLKAINNKFSSYVKVSFLFDKWNLLNYKDSPLDRGKEVFIELFKKRVILK